MKKGLAIAGMLFLLALLCTGLGVLVDGPDAVPDAPLTLPVQQTLYVLPTEASVGITDAEAWNEERHADAACVIVAHTELTADPPVRDRNGRPLGEGVYVQMVYEAFPP